MNCWSKTAGVSGMSFPIMFPIRNTTAFRVLGTATCTYIHWPIFGENVQPLVNANSQSSNNMAASQCTRCDAIPYQPAAPQCWPSTIAPFLQPNWRILVRSGGRCATDNPSPSKIFYTEWTRAVITCDNCKLKPGMDVTHHCSSLSAWLGKMLPAILILSL